jgi:hypothetical protein
VASYLLQQVNKVHRQGRNYHGQGKSTERKELPNKKEEIKSKPFMMSLAQAAGADTCKTKEEIKGWLVLARPRKKEWL